MSLNRSTEFALKQVRDQLNDFLNKVCTKDERAVVAPKAREFIEVWIKHHEDIAAEGRDNFGLIAAAGPGTHFDHHVMTGDRLVDGPALDRIMATVQGDGKPKRTVALYTTFPGNEYGEWATSRLGKALGPTA